jgi:hypothetical protein
VVSVPDATIADPPSPETVRADDHAEDVRAFRRSVPGTGEARCDAVGIEGRVEGLALDRFPRGDGPLRLTGECLLYPLCVATDRWGRASGRCWSRRARRGRPTGSRRPSRACAGGEAGIPLYESMGFDRRGGAVLEVSRTEHDCWTYARPR